MSQSLLILAPNIKSENHVTKMAVDTIHLERDSVTLCDPMKSSHHFCAFGSISFNSYYTRKWRTSGVYSLFHSHCIYILINSFSVVSAANIYTGILQRQLIQKLG